MRCEIQIAGYFLREVADGVGNRYMKSGMEFSICCQATRRIRGFEYQNSLAALRQVGRTHQPVVTCANDN